MSKPLGAESLRMFASVSYTVKHSPQWTAPLLAVHQGGGRGQVLCATEAELGRFTEDFMLDSVM